MNNSSFLFILAKFLFLLNRSVFKILKELFLILLFFFYLYPFWLKGLPLATNRLLQIGGICVFFIHLIRINAIKINKALVSTALYSIVITFGAVVALLAPKETDFYVVKYMFEMIFYIISSYFIINILKHSKSKFNFATLLDYVILASLLQAIISFIFFFNPPVYNFFVSFLNEDLSGDLLNSAGKIEVRMLGISNSFFTGVFNYGVVFLAICILPFIEGSILYKNKALYWISLILIAMAGIFTGRSFFIAIMMGLMLVLYINRQGFHKYIIKGFKVGLLVSVFVVIFLYTFQSFIKAERLDQIYDWTFELFINFSESGQFESRSTDAIIDMYRFPESVHTWLIGDGLFFDSNGTSYYKHIDVGFIRLIYYFGLPLTIIYYLIQYKYAKLGIFFYNERTIKIFIYFVLFYILILNLKGLLNGDKYFMLFIMTGVLLPHNKFKGIKTTLR